MLDSFSIKHATNEGKKNAFREVLILAIFSLSPLVLAYLGTMVFEGWKKPVIEIFLSGDLYYYTASIGGSVFIITQLKSHNNLLWMRVWSGIFVLFCLLLLAFYTGQSRIIHLAPDAEGTFRATHAILSVVVFLSAFFVYFRVRVLASQPPPDPEDVNRDNVEKSRGQVGQGYD